MNRLLAPADSATTGLSRVVGAALFALMLAGVLALALVRGAA